MSILYVDTPPPQYQDQFKNTIKQLPSYATTYIKDLFPIRHWILKYNLIWLSGDLTAAITVGTLVIPQSLAYAKIANLPPVFGLYTSFVGVILYPLFGTSKDISIGVTAISSLMAGQVIMKFVASEQFISGVWTYADAANTLTLFSGFIVLFIGLFRLGPIFNFICQPAIYGFMAGSGITILINQFSKIFGVPNINTSEAPYLVFGKTLIHLNHSTVDAAFGISALIYLYGVKYFSQYLLRKYPQRHRWIFFFNTSRSIVVLVFGTLLSFMINRFGHFATSPIAIIGIVPAGFGHMAVPAINTDILSFFAPDLPGIVVLLLMEHGAIASSLGKVSDYRVDMSQETFAIGLANIFGSFFCAYPGTGAFTRTAVMSKSGTRTPLTSFFVGLIVVLCIYVFTPAFTYIPNASLAAIIAHSVTDLISGPAVWRKFWDLHPSEFFIFACAYIISLFTRIDVSVYVPVVLSLIVQLYRTARPKYAVLGRMDFANDLEKQHATTALLKKDDEEKTNRHRAIAIDHVNDNLDHTMFFPVNHSTLGQYTRPIDSGIVCFQPQENIIFQNASFMFEKLIDEVRRTTRRGKMPAEKIGDRPWNNTEGVGNSGEKPLLHSVVLDMSGVHQMDYTGMESLADTVVTVERYTGHPVHWFIVTGEAATVRKSLLFAGFGNQRRHLRFVGQFLSDLKHGVEEGGHRPGVEGCESHLIHESVALQVGRGENISSSSSEIGDEKKGGGNMMLDEDVVAIESVHEHHSSRLADMKKIGSRRIHKQSTATKDNENDAVQDSECGSDDGTSKQSSAQWCYCDMKSNDYQGTNGISAVYDRFPFFFKSLHDAVRAALVQKNQDDEKMKTGCDDNISVISAKEVDNETSPS